jgi:hypothetical protein
MKIYAVYDSKADLYQSVMVQKNKGSAIRGFAHAVNQEGTYLNQNPEDFTLFELAEWDEDNGKITPHKTNLSCGLATEFINREN